MQWNNFCCCCCSFWSSVSIICILYVPLSHVHGILVFGKLKQQHTRTHNCMLDGIFRTKGWNIMHEIPIFFTSIVPFPAIIQIDWSKSLYNRAHVIIVNKARKKKSYHEKNPKQNSDGQQQHLPRASLPSYNWFYRIKMMECKWKSMYWKKKPE